MDNEANGFPGVADRFLARHTTDPALRCQLPSNQEGSTSNRPNESLRGIAEPAVNTNTVLPTSESTALSPQPALVSRAIDSLSTRRIQRQSPGANCSAAPLVYAAGNLDVPLSLISLPPSIRDHIVESVEFTNNSSLASEQRVSRATTLMCRVMEERAVEQQQFQRNMQRREQEIREGRERERIERDVREMEEASRWPQQQEAIPGLSVQALLRRLQAIKFKEPVAESHQ